MGERFTYTVTGQYGLQSTATASLEIASVNDAPVATGELLTSSEDASIIFTQAQFTYTVATSKTAQMQVIGILIRRG